MKKFILLLLPLIAIISLAYFLFTPNSDIDLSILLSAISNYDSASQTTLIQLVEKLKVFGGITSSKSFTEALFSLVSLFSAIIDLIKLPITLIIDLVNIIKVVLPI